MSNNKLELTRRRVLQGAAALAAGSLVPRGAFAQSNPQPQPPSGTKWYDVPTVTVTIPSTTTNIPGQFCGISYEKSNLAGSGPNYFFSSANTGLIDLFNLLGGSGGSVLRIGGDTQDLNTYTVQILSGAVTALGGFLAQTTGWNCLYGINLKGQDLAYGTTGYTNTTLASQEVKLAQNKLGSQLLGIEIGNEPDAWGGTEGAGFYPPKDKWKVDPYEQLWAFYQEEIGAYGAPGAPYAGPDAAALAEGWTEAFGDWTQTHSPKLPLNVLTHHFYIGDGLGNPQAKVAKLAAWNISDSSDTNGPNIYDFQTKVATYLQSFSTTYNIPYRMGETNSYYNGGASGVSNAYVSALWVIDYLFAIAAMGGAGANFHGGGSGIYSPLNDNGTSVTVVNPIFYGMVFFSMGLNRASGATNTLMSTVMATFDGVNVSGYCVQTSSTTATILLINKDQVWYFEPKITLPWVCTSATLVQLTGTSLDSLNVGTDGTYSSSTFIQGASIPIGSVFSQPSAYTLTTPVNNGNGTSTVTCWLPLISAVLIKVVF